MSIGCNTYIHEHRLIDTDFHQSQTSNVQACQDQVLAGLYQKNFTKLWLYILYKS